MSNLYKYLDLFKANNIPFETNIKEDTNINYISYNSKDIKENTLFVCKGMAFKENYLEMAINSGAVCYVSENIYNINIPYIKVENIRDVLCIIAKEHYQTDNLPIKLVGITGTKGKSTVSFYYKAIVDSFDKCGILSTISCFDGVTNKPASLTTPEPFELHNHFANAKSSSLNYLTMEVSSQALKYKRVEGVHYNTVAFLNIGLDHIGEGEHSDFNDYFTSKLKIFTMGDTAIINKDDKHFNDLYSKALECKCKVITYSLTGDADIYATEIKKEGHHIKFKSNLSEEYIVLKSAGVFNVANALAAMAIAKSFNIPFDNMKKGLEVAVVSGRMELYSYENICAVVDYAHNKLSFETALSSLREEFKGYKIISVFGCPGQKAPNRRSELPMVADTYSDMIIVTEDDPAEEKFLDICAEMVVHIKGDYLVIADRYEAILKATEIYKNNKVLIFIAGKGSEEFMKRGRVKEKSKSDSQMVKEIFERKAKYENV